MRRKSKPPKPVKLTRQQLTDLVLRRRLEKLAADRKAQAKAAEPKKKRGRPAKPKPETTSKPKPKEHNMPRHRRSETGEVVEATDVVADEPTKVYVFHLNRVTPAVPETPATETEPAKPAIPEIVEQQAEGVRWSDRTYTMHWTAQGPAVGYLTFPSLRHLYDTYPNLTLEFVGGAEPKDEEEAEVEARAKEAEEAELAAKEARARSEEAKARVEARHAAHA
jgi:hypothetical protein